MQFDTLNLVLFLLLGAGAGFLGGLIGIGGGFVLVPGLYYVFVHGGVAPGNEMPLVLGTTMAGIIFTAASSVRSHAGRGVIRFDLVQRFAPWIALGSIVGAVLATKLDATYVKVAFAIFCLYSASRMLFFSKNVVSTSRTIESSNLVAPGTFFGAVCGLIGVGGANLFVPYLMNRSLDIRYAMATASALQIPIAVISSAAFIVLGMGQSTPAGAFGYVYLPALAVVATSSIAFAPLGVRVAHKLPIPVLKKLFGSVAAIVGLKMAGAFSFVPALVLR